jgi:hypothetical protein
VSILRHSFVCTARHRTLLQRYLSFTGVEATGSGDGPMSIKKYFLRKDPFTGYDVMTPLAQILLVLVIVAILVFLFSRPPDPDRYDPWP